MVRHRVLHALYSTTVSFKTGTMSAHRRNGNPASKEWGVKILVNSGQIIKLLAPVYRPVSCFSCLETLLTKK